MTIKNNSVINFTDTAQWKNWEEYLKNISTTDTTNERLKLWHKLLISLHYIKKIVKKLKLKKKLIIH